MEGKDLQDDKLENNEESADASQSSAVGAVDHVTGNCKHGWLVTSRLPQLGCMEMKLSILRDFACIVTAGMCLVELTLHNGREKLGHGKSLFIVTILYMSHFFSAWVSSSYTRREFNTILLHPQGDRMWTFAVTLFLLRLYPESLLLVGVYGLIMQLAVVVFGTIVGDWVDTNARMKGVNP